METKVNVRPPKGKNLITEKTTVEPSSVNSGQKKKPTIKRLDPIGVCIEVKNTAREGSSNTWQEDQAYYSRSLKAEALTKLSSSLILQNESLRHLGVGHNGNSFTFPEYDDEGYVIGIATRQFDHSKLMQPSSSRGIIMPLRQIILPTDTLFLVEGHTDLAAILSMGLKGFGRPGCTLSHLPKLLARLPQTCQIVMVGENDGSDASPGWQNAEKLAQQLADDLGRPILSARLPEDVRDTREYLTSKLFDENIKGKVKWTDVGEWYTSDLLTTAQTIRPQGTDRFDILDLPSLMAIKDEHRWLIEGVLAANQPCVIGGPKKALKTSLATALAVSLATGTNFLDYFVTRGKRPVGIFSAESGRITLRDLAKRLLERLGASCPSYENIPLHMCFDVPKFSDEVDLKALTYHIRQHRLEVVIIDPLYLCALAGSKSGDASNMYHMGPLFRQAAEACLTAGATPIFVHHSRKAQNSPKDKYSKFAPPDLDDLAFAGISEFARQWLLLSRREAYVPDEGIHRLWMSVGGSAFGGRIHGLTVDEGVCSNQFEGRKWVTTVESYDDIAAERKERRVEAQEAKQEDMLQRVKDVLALPEFKEGATETDIRNKGVPRSGVEKALPMLTSQGEIEPCKVTKKAGRGNRTHQAHRLVQSKLLPKAGHTRPVLKLRGTKQSVGARQRASLPGAKV